MREAVIPSTGIAISYAEMSAIGGRQSNQDALGAIMLDDLACFVVADGAGGHDGGEIAANTVVEAIIDRFELESVFGARAMSTYIDSAIDAVAAAKADQAHLKDMSATVATVLIDLKNNRAFWAHLGDTRIYLFRRGKVNRMTKDHSIAQQFVDAGFWPHDSIRNHPQRSRLLAAIGSEGEMRPEVSAEPIQCLDGDVFLICTDGFWEWVTENEMEQSLGDAISAEQWLHQLCDTISKKADLSGKPRDNCTAYAIWLGEPEVITITR
jgi:serine/threonine protein phosphatase PrpC